MPGTIFANTGFDNYSVANPQYSASFSPSGANALESTGTVTLPASDKMTVTAWIKPSMQQANTHFNGVFSYGPGGACPIGIDNSFQLGIQGSGIPEFSAWCDSFLPAGGPAVDRNAWNFIAGELNGSKIDLFLNGLWLNGTIAGTGNLQPGNIIIGSNGTSAGSGFFNGSISDVQVYNATLTPQQLLQLYEQGFPIVERVNISG